MNKQADNQATPVADSSLFAKVSARYKAYRRDKQSRSVVEFAHKHKHLLVIVMDPKDDTVFASYRDVQVYNKLKSADGVEHGVVRSVLKLSKFQGNIDYFIAGMMEFINVSLKNPYMNQLMQWVDGAIYTIAKSLNIKK